MGFFDSGVALRKVSIRGGPPALVCRVSGAPRGASWTHGDTIVFATTDTSTGLLSVPAGGGEPNVLTKPNAQDGERDHFFPSVLPGGRSVLFTIDTLDRAGPSAVAILDLETGRYKRLLRGGRAEYLETGSLPIYQDEHLHWAVGFDLATQQVLGDPVPVVERLLGQNFSVSRQGMLVYSPHRRTLRAGRWCGSP